MYLCTCMSLSFDFFLHKACLIEICSTSCHLTFCTLHNPPFYLGQTFPKKVPSQTFSALSNYSRPRQRPGVPAPQTPPNLNSIFKHFFGTILTRQSKIGRKKQLLEICLKCCFLNGPFPTSVSFIFDFSIKLTVYRFDKICRWQDWNRGPLVSDVTSLPTEPQPLPWFT